MAPRFCAAYVCARKGCNGYRYVHLAVQNNEPLECTRCGSRFPKRTAMLPEPRRPPRDATPRRPAAAKGKGTGKGKGQNNVEKGRGKGVNADEDFPPLPRASAKPKAKAKSKPAWKTGPTPPPWTEVADDEEPEKENLFVDKRRLRTDPIYAQQMRVVLERTMEQPEALAKAEEKLEQVRAQHESEMSPDKRLVILRKRLRVAEASEDKLVTKVQCIQDEMNDAADRLHEAQLGLRAQKARTEAIRADVQATEALLPSGSDDADGGTKRVKAPLTLDEHLECVYQLLQGSYKMSEEASHALETQLRGIETLNRDLARVQAVNEAEDKLEEERRAKARAQLRGKRDRSQTGADGTDTPVATSENEEEVGMKVDLDPAPKQQEQPAGADAPAVIGPIGTVPFGPQAVVVPKAAPPAARGDRERSPRREVEPAAPAAADGTVRATAAQEAAIRGDLDDSLDSLPALEDPPPPTDSNPRGGDSLT